MLSEKTTAAVQEFLAEQELSAAINAAFLHAHPLPESPVQTVDYCGPCEDAETFTIITTLQDGHAIMISCCPGSPIAIARVD